VSELNFIKKIKKKFSKVFCFANTPPPVKMSVPVYTYSHNQKLFAADNTTTQQTLNWSFKDDHPITHAIVKEVSKWK